MISKRTYFTISLIMIVVFFMFLFSQTSRQTLSDYMYNQYEDEYDGSKVERNINLSEETWFYFGTSDEVYNTLNQWCGYRHYGLQRLDNISETEDSVNTTYVVVDGEHLSGDDIEFVYEDLQRDGSNKAYIFATLPSADDVEASEKLRKILGINNIVSKDMELEGYWIFDGVLVGGERVYTTSTKEEFEEFQDMDLTIPWYELSGGTKAYMIGYIDGEKYKSDEKTRNYPVDGLKKEFWPGVIWRNSIKNNRVFAVNGDYMKSSTGLGFLSVFESETEGNVIYPVVNSMNFVASYFPTFSEENKEQMDEIYVRDVFSIERDIIWPSLTAVATQDDYKLTCMASGSIRDEVNLGDKNKKYEYMMKLIREESGETGVVLDPTDKKSMSNYNFLQGTLKDYKFTSAYAGNRTADELAGELNEYPFKDIDVILGRQDEGRDVVNITEDGLVLLQNTSKADSHTFTEDLRERSIVTALGYSTITADMSSIIYPESEEDEWQNYSRRFSAYTDAFYDGYKDFEHTTLSEAAANVQTFLNAEYDVNIDGNVIEMHSKNPEGYYMFRTNNKDIKDIKGANIVELEDNMYLLELVENDVRIELEEKEKPIYSFK